MQPGDPRADITVVDLIELAGLWVAAEDWSALVRTLQLLDAEFARRFPADGTLRQRFRELLALVESQPVSAEEVRRTYRRAAVG